MATCPNCSAQCPNEFKYCGNCGRPIASPQVPAYFELGKIAALDEVKKSVLAWVAGVGSIITLVGGYALFSFIAAGVATNMESKIKPILDRSEVRLTILNEELTTALADARSKVNTLKDSIGESSSLKNTMDQELKLSTALLQSLKQQLLQLQEQEAKINLEMATLTQGIEVKKVFERLVFDLYHIKSSFLSSRTEFSESCKDFIQNDKGTLSSFQINFLDSEGNNVIQFHPVRGGGTIINDVILAHNLEMYQAYEDIKNLEIDFLKKIKSAEVVFTVFDGIPAELGDSLSACLHDIRNVHVVFYVNEVRMYEWDFPGRNLAKKTLSAERSGVKMELAVHSDVSKDFEQPKESYNEKLSRSASN